MKQTLFIFKIQALNLNILLEILISNLKMLRKSICSQLSVQVKLNYFWK